MCNALVGIEGCFNLSVYGQMGPFSLANDPDIKSKMEFKGKRSVSRKGEEQRLELKYQRPIISVFWRITWDGVRKVASASSCWRQNGLELDVGRYSGFHDLSTVLFGQFCGRISKGRKSWTWRVVHERYFETLISTFRSTNFAPSNKSDKFRVPSRRENMIDTS